ncbi:hypothetical protein [Paraburkholderia kirstenboschensis]|uniref:SAM-dependent methyltransferase n=1 Tax=Paraburkholderia kirstenboschensis TaxID=1245436 RepID=A0ABZ0EQL1_9BURK|nr:hypothetical protein [Paraburkholderia kirstenboschensis]WOD18647.1 hypothetical protein RW095_38765 [Paraburkholderia kirstenboschensis]
MKRCLVCDALYAASDMACPAGGWQPTLQNRLPAYAPALSAESSGFKASYFAEWAALGCGNFWFEARDQLIVALRSYASDFFSFLEVGCGSARSAILDRAQHVIRLRVAAADDAI